MLAATVSLVVALLAGTWWLATSRAPEEQPDPMSILIADLDNQTGDATFDGAVEQALDIAMEGAGFISSYSRPKAQKVAAQLLPDSALDATMARLVSRREGIDVVLAGSIAKRVPVIASRSRPSMRLPSPRTPKPWRPSRRPPRAKRTSCPPSVAWPRICDASSVTRSRKALAWRRPRPSPPLPSKR